MQKTRSAVIFSAVALFSSSCGSILPDKFWYPVESGAPQPKQEQKAEAAKPAPPAEKPKPVEKPKPAAEEPRAPLEEGDAVIFGDAPAAKEPRAEASAAPAAAASPASSPAGKGPAPEKMERLANPLAMVLPAPGDKPAPLPPLDAQDSAFGNNSLTRTFPLPFDDAWQKTLEVMLAAPLTVIDKSSGIIITEWMIQQRAGGGMGMSLFGTGERVVRYKYAVKMYDQGGKTEVVVITYTQYIEGRQWLDAKPRRMISEHLMRLLVAKLEAR